MATIRASSDCLTTMPPQSAAAAAPWSDLLPELLGRIASYCTNPADRARFRSVCRPWHSAVRHHCPQTPLLPPPCVVFPDGSFLMLSDADRDLPPAILPHNVFSKPAGGGKHHLTLPEGTTCVGSTDSWLGLCRSTSLLGGEFMLYNPFSHTTVPLPGVDAICAKTPPDEWFRALKVLMRSGADDMVVVTTVSRSYPFVLSLPGKGAWAPDPDAPPFMHIIDVAFLGDKLYGITRAEDLFSFDLSSVDDDQAPAITRCERVIRHPLEFYNYDVVVPWSDVEDEDDQDNDDELDLPVSGEEDEDDNSEKEEDEGEEDDDDDDSCFEHDTVYPPQVPSSIDWSIDGADNDCTILTIRYLVADESCGKLIMVRRELRMPDDCPSCTRTVEVFETDAEAGEWVPSERLGNGGQVLFVGKRFSKLVSTSEYGEELAELDDDSIYFMDTGDVFHMASAAISPARWCLDFWDPTWVFPPGLVV